MPRNARVCAEVADGMRQLCTTNAALMQEKTHLQIDFDSGATIYSLLLMWYWKYFIEMSCNSAFKAVIKTFRV